MDNLMKSKKCRRMVSCQKHKQQQLRLINREYLYLDGDPIDQ